MTWNRCLVRGRKAGVFFITFGLVYVASTILFRQNTPDIRASNPRTELKSVPKPNSSQIVVSKKTGKIEGKARQVHKNEQKNISKTVFKSKETISSLTSGLYSVQGFPTDIHLFSAVVGNSSSALTYDSIVIQGLESSEVKNALLVCCINYKSENVVTQNVTRKIRWMSSPNNRMAAVHYICPRPYKKKGLPVGITISGVTKGTKCSQKFDMYMKPHYAQAHNKQLGVCTKAVQSDVNLNDILSWFEIHRQVGVDKFVVYTYKLTTDVAKVLKYYENKGSVEIHPFSLPKINQGKQVVTYGSKNFEALTIEQMLMYDCLQRLKGYKYLLVLDIDEYLIPKKFRRLPTMFESLWKKKPSAAGFSFLTHVYITSWKATSNSVFTARKYTNRTVALEDRMKHVTKPERLEAGGLSTYSFTPKKNFQGFRAEKTETTVYQFRSCDKSSVWQKEMDKNCQKWEGFKDTSVSKVLAPLENNILLLKSEILKKG